MANPNLFLVGQPRSGTTSLQKWLSLQSDVFMCTPKEPNFFAPDLRCDLDVCTLEHYESLFFDVDYARWVGEASVCYLYSTLAAKLISEFNPQAKIVMVLREPIDYIISVYHKRRSNPRGSCEIASTVDKAVALEAERRAGRCIPKGVDVPQMLFYTERAKYYSQVRRYLDYFPREQVFFTVFEDLITTSTRELARLAGFLEIDNANLHLPRVNESVTVGSRTAYDLLEHAEMGVGAFRYLKYAAQRMMSDHLRGALKKGIRNNLISKRKTTISEPLRNRLKDELRDDVSQLSELLEYDFLRRWGYEL